MASVFSELVVYIIKFLAMLVCAFLGIMVGKNIRAKKDAEQASQTDLKE